MQEGLDYCNFHALSLSLALSLQLSCSRKFRTDLSINVPSFKPEQNLSADIFLVNGIFLQLKHALFTVPTVGRLRSVN